MVKINVLLPLSRIVLGLKTLLIVGGATTVRLAVLLAVPATGVCVVVTPDVVFGCTPAVLLVTSKMTVQLLLVGIVIPLKPRAVAPATRLFGVVPTHVPVTLPPAALIFVNVSVNDAPVSVVEVFELLKVNVTVLVPPDWIDVGLKALAIVGGFATVRLAVAVLPVPPFVDVTAVVVFVYWPPAAPVTVTLNWHWPPAAIVVLESVIVFPPSATRLFAPPQTL